MLGTGYQQRRRSIETSRLHQVDPYKNSVPTDEWHVSRSLCSSGQGNVEGVLRWLLPACVNVSKLAIHTSG